jgi:transcriptional regulator with XRE-family HTH domain
VGFLLGVKHGAKVSRYENRRRIPPLRTALAYATILDVPLARLFPDLQKQVQAEVAGRSRQLQAKLTEARAGTRGARRAARMAEWLKQRHVLKKTSARLS